MSDFSPPAERLLSEVERQAFQRLGLTPGHWAALAPAPLFYRADLRAPNRRYRSDLDTTELLRLELRTIGGMSTEAGHFWERLGDGSRRSEAILATRLLAWHVATDLPFARRASFVLLLRNAANHFFITRYAHPPRTHEAVQHFRWLVDSYLPYPNFLPTVDPPLVGVIRPSAEVLNSLAETIHSPQISAWPVMHPMEAPRWFPTLVRALGEPARDWWKQPDPTRRAAERGLASHSFEERQQVYSAVISEWTRALGYSYPTWPNPEGYGQRLVTRMREWVDAVRFASRKLAPLRAVGTDDHATALVSSSARPLTPEYIRIPEPRDMPVATPVATPVAVTEPVAVKAPSKPEPERVSVQVASQFTLVRLEDALARARATPVAEVCAWLDTNTSLLFDDCREEAAREIAVVRTEVAVPEPLWVVGDLHADVLTLANIIALAESHATRERPPHFLFLGDFIDRGFHDHELLLLLFRLMMDHPDRVCVVPGNHDIDLHFDETAHRFRVTIEPAEYCEALNAALKRDTPEDRERVTLAKAFIRFCAGRPKAVFLPDGTLFTHGGFPHTDMQKEIAALADLCKPRCLDDFLWARIAESARVKRPNRGSRGHEFGWDTLVQFAKIAGEKLGLSVKRLVRGHDHVTDRWMEYPEYATNGIPVLTINAMGRLLDGEPTRRDGRHHPLPVVARCVPDRLPEVFQLPLDPAEVDRAFNRARPKPPETVPEPVANQVLTQQLPKLDAKSPAKPAEERHGPGPDGREPGPEAAP
jgi:hypothetical protein